jgi:hypothetical protein
MRLTKPSKTDAIVASVISRFGAAFRIRTEDLLIAKAVWGHAVVLHSVPNRSFSSRGMWVLYAVCVPLRFKSFQQFARSWGENGEKSFSPKPTIAESVPPRHRKALD